MVWLPTVTQDAWITLGVVGAMAAALVRNVGPDLVLVAGLTVLLVTGVLAPEEAFLGFANPAVVTIGALLIVAAGLQETGALDYLVRRALGRPRNVVGAQLRVMLPVSALSAFLNNTPVVAMFVPLLQSWGRQTKIPPSKLLMPLSYAAILGGTCTLIGTSTNLVVAGMARAHPEQLEIGIFDVAWLGVPALVVGTIYVVVASRWLLPDRSVSGVARDLREYTLAMRVVRGAPIIGQTIEQAGLRQLETTFLYEVERAQQVMPAVAPSTRILEGDVLRFTGVVDDHKDLRKLGLVPESDQVAKLEGRPERRWVEAVVAPQSELVGKSVKESRFRTNFNAAIIAVSRQGARVETKVGDIRLEPGDVLLLETHPQFVRKHRRDPSFLLVSEVEGSEAPRHDRAWRAGLVLVAMVGVNASGLLPLSIAALTAAGAMLLCGCLRGNQARRALNLQVLVTVGAALGIGLAMEKSGAGRALGEAIVTWTMPLGTAALLGAIYATTAVIAGTVYTAAGAALMFPVAAAAARAQELPLLPVALLVMIAAGTAFSTPVGYAANMIVKGPGGYRYTDFLKLGLPLQAIIGIVSVIVVMWRWI